MIYINIFSNVIDSCDDKAELVNYSAFITHVFIVNILV